MNFLANRKEDHGFTLVELLVVIIVIGIITAVAVPAFLNQREKANEAAVKSDLRNAATVMDDAYVDRQQYPAYVPSYNNTSENSEISLDLAYSSKENYCLKGVVESDPTTVFFYDSSKGGLLPPGTTCTPTSTAVGSNAQSFGEGLAQASVLVIYDREDKAVSKLNSVGITDVEVNESVTTLSELQGYDLIVASGSRYFTPTDKVNLLREAQQAGYNILTDGNDSTSSSSPFVRYTKYYSDGNADYIPTGNSINPAFPEFKTSSAFSNDTWNCPTTLYSGSVSLATYTAPDATKCHTMMASVKNGKWLHMVLFREGSAFQAAALWVTQ